PDEVYAVTAFLLNLNEIVGDDFVLSRETFASIGMPNRKNFTGDDRTVSEKAFWKKEPCMKNCKASVKIMGRARLSGIAPDAGKKAGGSPR
ncbi:MAG: cytochrome c, partial [Hyphomicrobiales bacterium]|nr:cytochrome c [Hyphomicrobiales bacterium]